MENGIREKLVINGKYSFQGGTNGDEVLTKKSIEKMGD